MSAPPELPKTLEMPYRWGSVEGSVRVEMGINDDPAALGCAEFARGFPYFRATLEPPTRGYAEVLGWVQLADASHLTPGFKVEFFELLGPVPHPFAFYGWAPTFFDAPHTDFRNWDFLAHTFLCGLGGELFEFRHEVRAILGFSWSISKRDQRIEWSGPEPLSPQDWDSHRKYLDQAYAEWSFAPGFAEDPLQP